MTDRFTAGERFCRRHDDPELTPGEVLRRVHDAGDERDLFHKDRDKLIYSPFLRRLGGVTQIMSAATFGTEAERLHNRLTHTLEVAQIARRLAERAKVQQPDLVIDLGGVNPDVAETASWAHDLGHPPFGHHGERVLSDLMTHYPIGNGSELDCGGFEGNAQSFRIVSVLSTYIADEKGGRVFKRGLNLTRASYLAVMKYPWERTGSATKFGVYSTEEDLDAFRWATMNKSEKSRSPEAEIMDFADDVAYSIFDIYDFVRRGSVDIYEYKDATAFRSFYEPKLNSELRHVKDILSDDIVADKVRDVLFGPTKKYTQDHQGEADLSDYSNYLVGLLTGDDARSLKGAGAEFAFRLTQPKSTLVSGVPVLSCAEINPITRVMISILKAITRDLIHQADRALHEQEGGAGILRPLVLWVESEINGYIRKENKHLWLLGSVDDLINTAVEGSGPRGSEKSDKALKRLACDIVASLSEQEAMKYYEKYAKPNGFSI